MGIGWGGIRRRLRRGLERRASRPQEPRPRFALVGAAGWIARTHLAAIRDAGGELVAAFDRTDAGIGILDDYFPDADFYLDEAEFETSLRARSDSGTAVAFVGICSPDWLHPRHSSLALRAGADAICEKPLVLDLADLDALRREEEATGHRVHPIAQHRYNPAVLRLAQEVAGGSRRDKAEVEITFVAPRGRWYLQSWRGRPGQAGGLALDIGIHVFDLLPWIFGALEVNEVHWREERSSGGYLELERARVRWFLSIDQNDLPTAAHARGARHWRSLRVDGRDVELSREMAGLHLTAYREILAGRGLSLADVRPGLEIAIAMGSGPLSRSRERLHPQVREKLDRAEAG